MAYQHLLLDRKDQIATITLNRPDAYNALNRGLGRDLFHAVLEVDDDPGRDLAEVRGRAADADRHADTADDYA